MDFQNVLMFKVLTFNIKQITDFEQGVIQDIEKYIKQPEVNIEDEVNKSYIHKMTVD